MIVNISRVWLGEVITVTDRHVSPMQAVSYMALVASYAEEVGVVEQPFAHGAVIFAVTDDKREERNSITLAYDEYLLHFIYTVLGIPTHIAFDNDTIREAYAERQQGIVDLLAEVSTR